MRVKIKMHSFLSFMSGGTKSKAEVKNSFYVITFSNQEQKSQK